MNYNNAIEISPNLPYLYFNRGSSFEHMGDYNNAIKNYDKVI